MAHIQKFKAAGMAGVLGHNERRLEARGFKRENIDPSLTHLNYSITTEHDGGANVYARRVLSDRGIKPRSNAVGLFGVVVSLPDGVRPGDERKFYEAELRALCRFFPTCVLIQAIVHKDEPASKNGHMHVELMPLTEDGRLCAKEILTRAAYKGMHPALQKAADEALGYHVQVLLDDGNEKAAEYVGLSEYKRATAENARLMEENARLMETAQIASERAEKAVRDQERAQGAQRAAESATTALKAVLGRQGAQLRQKDEQLRQKDEQLRQKDEQLAGKDAELEQANAKLAKAGEETEHNRSLARRLSADGDGINWNRPADGRIDLGEQAGEFRYHERSIGEERKRRDEERAKADAEEKRRKEAEAATAEEETRLARAQAATSQELARAEEERAKADAEEKRRKEAEATRVSEEKKAKSAKEAREKAEAERDKSVMSCDAAKAEAEGQLDGVCEKLGKAQAAYDDAEEEIAQRRADLDVVVRSKHLGIKDVVAAVVRVCADMIQTVSPKLADFLRKSIDDVREQAVDALVPQSKPKPRKLADFDGPEDNQQAEGPEYN